MKSFLSFGQYVPKLKNEMLTEELSLGNIMKAALPITRYLKKKTGIPFVYYPELEAFKNSSGKGFGLRLYSGGKIPHSIRFNFKSSSPNLVGVETITFWRNKKKWQLTFDKQVSLVQVLPTLAALIKSNTIPTKVYTAPTGALLEDIVHEDISLDSYYLHEGRGKGTRVDNPQEMIKGVLKMITQEGFTKSKVSAEYGHAGWKIINALEVKYPELIKKEGKSLKWQGTEKELTNIQKNDIEAIMEKAGIVSAKVSIESSKEEYPPDADIKSLENNQGEVERLTFEQQLKDMKNLIKFTIGGLSNAAFIAGKGGVGKTFSTEETLKELGLYNMDDEDTLKAAEKKHKEARTPEEKTATKIQGTYFKSTGGSTSTAALYRLLVQYRDGLIVFDDSDSIFGKEESRNLLKAATEDKPKRTLAYNKENAVSFPSDQYETLDDVLEDDKIPKKFTYTGRIIYISNLPMKKLDPDGALATRAQLVNIDPTDLEVYEFMEKIAPDMKLKPGLYLSLEDRMHVVKLIREGKSKQSANLRKLKRGLNMYAGAHQAKVNLSESELERMIQTYA